MNAHAKNVTVIPAKTQGPAPGQPAKKKLRVAAYCRVSTDKDEQLNSFEVQKTYYTEKIASNPNWKMADIFADEGISGVSMKKRDEFKRMLRHCREGRIDLILVKSVSRFGRNTVDIMRTVRNLRERGVTVIFEKENLDTSQMTSELMLAFFSAFSQSESESIRENIIRGNAMAYAQGKVSVSPAMFGFKKGGDGEPVIDEEQAGVVRMIYKDYLDGMTPGDIKKKLERMHIKTAFGRDTWSTTVILALLQNEKYRGDALLQKTFSPSLFAERSKVNNGERAKYYVSNCLPVIVEPELWQQVQEEIARRRAKRASTEKAKNPLEGRHRGKYALSELLVCGKCGSPYRRTTWAKKGKKKIVWRCGTRLDYGTQFCNESPTLEEGALHTAIVNGIMNQYINVGADMELLKANLDRALAPQIPGGEADIRARITELTRQKQDLVARCMEENDITKYELLLTNIVNELEQLNQRLAGIESQQKNRAITDSRMAEIDELLGQFAESGMEYDDILTRRLVSTIHVKSAEEIEITFKDGKTRTENM
ncbi:recombinase family protein [Acutalibacter intestini]|uniref:recombinase family protein n=1 Tax=Acutalibacter intestini TaxID=3093659 RepID=UPI002AC93A99|nr:recombinase family protein [Acutalibacter sp. M00204]